MTSDDLKLMLVGGQVQLRAYTVPDKVALFLAYAKFNKATTVRYFLLLSIRVKVWSVGTFLYVNVLFMMSM